MHFLQRPCTGNTRHDCFYILDGEDRRRKTGPRTAFCNIKIAQLLNLIERILHRLEARAKDLEKKKKQPCDSPLSSPAGLTDN